MLEEWLPDGLITDLEMPDEDGFSLFAASTPRLDAPWSATSRAGVTHMDGGRTASDLTACQHASGQAADPTELVLAVASWPAARLRVRGGRGRSLRRAPLTSRRMCGLSKEVVSSTHSVVRIPSLDHARTRRLAAKRRSADRLAHEPEPGADARWADLLIIARAAKKRLAARGHSQAPLTRPPIAACRSKVPDTASTWRGLAWPRRCCCWSRSR